MLVAFISAHGDPTAVDAGRNDVDLAPDPGCRCLHCPFDRFSRRPGSTKRVARRIEQFAVAHVWTHESRHDPNDAEPFMRGINSIQLFNDGSRWWILSIYWQQESPQHAIPEKYFQG
jgi:hypothetical protein